MRNRIILLITLFPVSLVIIGLALSWRQDHHEQQVIEVLNSIDHKELLVACRKMLNNKNL